MTYNISKDTLLTAYHALVSTRNNLSLDLRCGSRYSEQAVEAMREKLDAVDKALAELAREVKKMSAMKYIVDVEITRGTAPEGLPSEISFQLYCEFFCNESDYGNGYHVSIEGKGFNDLYYDIRYDRDFDPKYKAEWLEQWARNFWHGKNGAWAVKDLKVTEVQD